MFNQKDASQSEDYLNHRKCIDALFIQANRLEDSVKMELSDSGKYKLNISQYVTGKKSWNYSRGIISGKDDVIIADVKRNYHDFIFCWIENHPNGHDYIICGENYQGQTIIELDTKTRKDYFPTSGKDGFGFCWVEQFCSPDKRMLAVEGCVWGGPSSLIVFDFSNPLNLPYKKLKGYSELAEFKGWNKDNSLDLVCYSRARKRDLKLIDDLTSAEEMDIYLEKEQECIVILECKWHPEKGETIISKNFDSDLD